MLIDSCKANTNDINLIADQLFHMLQIILIIPFVFNNKNNDWKWRKYIYLLEPLNSEKCGSSILEIIKTKTFDKISVKDI